MKCYRLVELQRLHLQSAQAYSSSTERGSRRKHAREVKSAKTANIKQGVNVPSEMNDESGYSYDNYAKVFHVQTGKQNDGDDELVKDEKKEAIRPRVVNSKPPVKNLKRKPVKIGVQKFGNRRSLNSNLKKLKIKRKNKKPAGENKKKKKTNLKSGNRTKTSKQIN